MVGAGFCLFVFVDGWMLSQICSLFCMPSFYFRTTPGRWMKSVPMHLISLFLRFETKELPFFGKQDACRFFRCLVVSCLDYINTFISLLFLRPASIEQPQTHAHNWTYTICNFHGRVLGDKVLNNLNLVEWPYPTLPMGFLTNFSW